MLPAGPHAANYGPATALPFEGWVPRVMAGELAVIWGEAVYVARLGILLYAPIVTLLGHLVVVYVEEPELRERFGEQYETYCRRVPRWLPRRSATARG